jgi:hypothetical protein
MNTTATTSARDIPRTPRVRAFEIIEADAHGSATPRL